MAFGDFLKKATDVAKSAMEDVKKAADDVKASAAEAAEKRKAEEARLAEERRQEAEKRRLEEEERKKQEKIAKENAKKERVARILEPTCENGDCLWYHEKFYFTCPDCVSCPRKSSTKKMWGEKIENEDIWEFMKRMESLDKFQEGISTPEIMEQELQKYEESVRGAGTLKDLAAMRKELIIDLCARFCPTIIENYVATLKAIPDYLYQNPLSKLYIAFACFGLFDGPMFNILLSLWDAEITAPDLPNKLFYIAKGSLDDDEELCITGREINLGADYFLNPSLYNRSFNDFLSTINILDMAETGILASDYPQLTMENVIDEDGNIKPYGYGGPRAGEYGDTLWNLLYNYNGDEDVANDTSEE